MSDRHRDRISRFLYWSLWTVLGVTIGILLLSAAAKVIGSLP